MQHACTTTYMYILYKSIPHKPGWKIALVGSRFTHAAESKYTPIKGEALAVADGLGKARYFILGCVRLTITVEH